MPFNQMHEFWTPLFVFLALLGVVLLFLGIILGAAASASRTKKQK